MQQFSNTCKWRDLRVERTVRMQISRHQPREALNSLDLGGFCMHAKSLQLCPTL